jgi:hypothetical protein
MNEFAYSICFYSPLSLAYITHEKFVFVAPVYSQFAHSLHAVHLCQDLPALRRQVHYSIFYVRYIFIKCII